MFWTLFLLSFFVIWVYLVIVVISDIFRSHDLGGFGKAMWTLFVLVMPILGVVIYLAIRGGDVKPFWQSSN
jgi:hypothetical protein